MSHPMNLKSKIYTTIIAGIVIIYNNFYLPHDFFNYKLIILLTNLILSILILIISLEILKYVLDYLENKKI